MERRVLLTFLVTLGPLALVVFFYNSQNDLAYCFTPWCLSQTKPLGSVAERALGQQQSGARCEHTVTGAIASVGVDVVDGVEKRMEGD